MSQSCLSNVIKKTFLFLFAAILFLLPCANAMAEDKMCADLKKINNLDEMLYQFYVNLDSDCLFTMPLAELEEAWGIKILSQERLQPGQKFFELWESADFSGKPYHSEADAFFIVASRIENKTEYFRIYITEAYDEAHATLFPEGNYPRLIPEPIKKLMVPPPHRHVSPNNKPRFPKKTGVYNRDYSYHWSSPDKTRIISITPGLTNSVRSIIVFGKRASKF